MLNQYQTLMDIYPDSTIPPKADFADHTQSGATSSHIVGAWLLVLGDSVPGYVDAVRDQPIGAWGISIVSKANLMVSRYLEEFKYRMDEITICHFHCGLFQFRI